MAIFDQAVRIHVERILANKYDADDLHKLFMFARDPARSQGREAMVDFGGFIAHPERRDRGIISTTTRDTYAILKFKIGELADGKPLDLRDLRSDWRSAAIATFPRLEAKGIKKNTGMSQSEARRAHRRVMARVVAKADGRFSLPDDLTSKEVSLVKYVASMLVPKPGYSGANLYADFVGVLRGTHVLQSKEVGAFIVCRNALILRAVAAMHGSSVKIDENNSVNLSASVHNPTGRIWVCMQMATQYRDKEINMAAPVFDTDLQAKTYCDASLPAVSLWDFPIEYASGERLRRMALHQ